MIPLHPERATILRHCASAANVLDPLEALRHIAGHEDLDRGQVPASNDASIPVPRKRDPGPRFPWPRVPAALPFTRIG